MIRVNQEKCTACGICGQVCPRHIPETFTRGGKKVTEISPERRGLCMECGHCTAVCPVEAIHLDRFGEQAFVPIRETGIGEEQLLLLMRQRRSVRRYRNKPVPREVIGRVVEGAHCAPTGTGAQRTGVIVIDNQEKLGEFSGLAFQMYEDLGRQLKNPIARFIIKNRVGSNKLATLTSFVMPGMAWYIRWFKEGRGNEILRDCPALMLFHSPADEPVGAENCLVAAYQAVLMAQVVGLGTCFNDLILPVCNRVPEVRRLLDLPPDREVQASVTLGYPKYEFQRTPPRRMAEVRYLS